MWHVWGEERVHAVVWRGSLMGRGHMEGQGFGGMMILNRKVMGWEGMDWIDLAEDRKRWRALLDVVMNFRVP